MQIVNVLHFSASSFCFLNFSKGNSWSLHNFFFFNHLSTFQPLIIFKSLTSTETVTFTLFKNLPKQVEKKSLAIFKNPIYHKAITMV